MITLAEALRRMPPNFYLKCGMEEAEDGDEDDEGIFLSAVIMEEPPEGGWPTRGAYFGHNPPEGPEEFPWKFDDSCRVGVSGSADDPANFERLVIDMIVRRWPEPADVARDPEGELKAALERRLDSCFCDDVGQYPECERCTAIRELLRILEARPAPPIAMLLWCPKCHVQHVDRGEWATPAKAHRKHLCEACGHVWKPAAAATVGVEKLPEE